MKPKVKKIVTIGLALSAVGIWVPQLLMGVVQKAPRERQEVANDGGSFEPALDGGMPQMGMEGGAAELSFMDAEPAEQGTVTGANHEMSLPQALSKATERVELRDSSLERVGLSELLNAFRPDSIGAETTKPQRSGDESNEEATAERTGELFPSPGETLARFCREQLLTAVIHGENGAIAMIGGRPVHSGDVLAEGIRVVTIERRSVTLTLRGATQAMGMPAFEARRSSSVGSTSTTDSDDSEPIEPKVNQDGATSEDLVPLEETTSTDSQESETKDEGESDGE